MGMPSGTLASYCDEVTVWMCHEVLLSIFDYLRKHYNICIGITSFSLIVVVGSHCRCKGCKGGCADSSGSEGRSIGRR